MLICKRGAMAELLVKTKKPRQYAKERKDAVDNSIERIAELREDRNSGALGDEVIKMAQALILCTLPYRPTDERQVVRTARLSDGSTLSAHGSEMDWNRAPARLIVSTISSRLRVERARRSSFQTVTMSPTRSWSSIRFNSGLSR